MSRLSRRFAQVFPANAFDDVFFPSRPTLAAIPRIKDLLLSEVHSHQMQARGQSRESWATSSGMPKVTLDEETNEYNVSVHLPEGMQASDISLKVEEQENGNNIVHLSGLRKETSKDGKWNWQSQFSHRFSLGYQQDLDTEQLTAKLYSDKGILTLSAPKKEPSTPRKEIEIEIVGDNGKGGDEASTTAAVDASENEVKES